MKKVIIILSVIALIAGGCGQAGKKQAETEPEINNVGALINNEISDEDEAFGEYSPVKKNDWEGVDCDLYIDKDKVTKTQYCIFPKAKLQHVYNIVKQIDTNLKTKLPAGNIDYFITKGDVKYKFESKYEVLIVLNYDVSVTIIHIKEGENKTESWISYTEKYEDSDCFIDTDWEGAKCKHYDYDLYKFYEITFPNANMQQVYDIVKKMNTKLKQELPADNIDYSTSIETLKYHYNTKKHLIIDLKYSDDGTYSYDIDIIEKENKTKFMVITYGEHF